MHFKWSWETYKPGPEVYDSLWHIRKAPPVISHALSGDCPIRNAESRILARRQTEDGLCRNFYVVKVRYLGGRYADADEESDDEDDHMHGVADGDGLEEEREETIEVDMSVILRYVSERELERFENAEFRAEAEAEAAHRQAEAEEAARRQLEKNARNSGLGRGSKTSSHPGIDQSLQRLDKGRGRGRGRGKGRGRDNGRGGSAMGNNLEDQMPALDLNDEDMDKVLDTEGQPGIGNEESLERSIAEAESDEDTEEENETSPRNQGSPDLMRSAFVANSALPTSPMAMHRRLSNAVPAIHYRHLEVLDLDELDKQSMSSAAENFEDDQSHRHRSKRLRTESTSSSSRHNIIRNNRSVPHVVIPKTHTPRKEAEQPPSASSDSSSSESDDEIPSQVAATSTVSEEPEDQDDNEYIVESILDHSYRDGIKYYLVKWDGHANATDWLKEGDLDNVQELIGEYEEMIRRRKLKRKGAMGRVG